MISSLSIWLLTFLKMQLCMAELWPGWAHVQTEELYCKLGILPQTLVRALMDEKQTTVSHPTDSRKGRGNQHFLSTNFASEITWSSSYRLWPLSFLKVLSAWASCDWAHVEVWDTVPRDNQKNQRVTHTLCILHIDLDYIRKAFACRTPAMLTALHNVTPEHTSLLC